MSELEYLGFPQSTINIYKLRRELVANRQSVDTGLFFVGEDMLLYVFSFNFNLLYLLTMYFIRIRSLA